MTMAFAEEKEAKSTESVLDTIWDKGEKAQKEVFDWIEKKREESQKRFNKMLGRKEDQTSVFFGTIASIFVSLVIIFLFLYAANIIRDIFKYGFNKASYRFGKSGSDKDYSFTPLTTASSNDPKSGRRSGSASGQGEGSIKSTRKPFLLGEVICQYINPKITLEHIQHVLRIQKKRDPRPPIGKLLIEFKLSTEEQIAKALDLQGQLRKKFRAQTGL